MLQGLFSIEDPTQTELSPEIFEWESFFEQNLLEGKKSCRRISDPTLRIRKKDLYDIKSFGTKGKKKVF